MKASTKRVLSIFSAAALFFASVLVYSNLIRPEFDRVAEKRAVVTAKEEVFSTQKEAVDQVKNVISQAQGMESVRETVSLTVPEDPDTTGILRQLSAIANANQVAFTSFSIETPVPPRTKDFLVKQLAVVRMQMSVFGPYEGLKGFLRGLETNVRVASIENAEIRPVSSGGGELYSLAVKVEFFYQK